MFSISHDISETVELITRGSYSISHVLCNITVLIIVSKEWINVRTAL